MRWMLVLGAIVVGVIVIAEMDPQSPPSAQAAAPVASCQFDENSPGVAELAVRMRATRSDATQAAIAAMTAQCHIDNGS